MNIKFLDSVDSTNTYLMSKMNEFDSHTMVVAKEQTFGKGRNGKVWFSPNGNLYSSFLIKPYSTVAGQITWVGGLAALFTLRELTGLKNLWIKWPNDIYCGIEKMAGMLSEATPSSIGIQNGGIVLGIGINLNSSLDDFKGIEKPATSAYIQTNKEFDIKKSASLLYNNIVYLLDVLTHKGSLHIYNMWRKENKLIGNYILANCSGDVSRLKVIDLKEDGSLVGLNEQGQIENIYSADVTIDKIDFI